MIADAVNRLQKLSTALALSFGLKTVFELFCAIFFLRQIYTDWGTSTNMDLVYILLFFVLTEIQAIVSIMIVLRDRKQAANTSNHENDSAIEIEDNIEIIGKDLLFESVRRLSEGSTTVSLISD
jgi:hypothetical protein